MLTLWALRKIKNVISLSKTKNKGRSLLLLSLLLLSLLLLSLLLLSHGWSPLAECVESSHFNNGKGMSCAEGSMWFFLVDYAVDVSRRALSIKPYQK